MELDTIQFPGRSAGASLKDYGEHVGRNLPTEIPRQICRGLIEGMDKAELADIYDEFPGRSAGASLKGLVGASGVRAGAGVIPRQICRGLIEGVNTPSGWMYKR